MDELIRKCDKIFKKWSVLGKIKSILYVLIVIITIIISIVSEFDLVVFYIWCIPLLIFMLFAFLANCFIYVYLKKDKVRNKELLDKVFGKD